MSAGDGTVSAPPIFESDRSRNWGPTGWFFLSQGDTITLDWEHSGAGTTLDGLAHFSVPYRPAEDSRDPRCVPTRK